MPDIHRPVTRRLRLFLRDFRMIEAFVSTAEGQPLTSYVSNRRRYINLRAAHWADATSDRSHAALQVSHVLWASAPDGDMPLVNSSGVSRPREVELQLEGGLVVRGALPIFEQQRLSDFLESTATFIPLQSARLLRSGRPPKDTNVDLGDIVVNQAALQAIWEAEAGVPVSEVAKAWSDE
ncbi:MAG: hypothetical protein GX539_13125 [Candidatus Cloacimonetes bacterium]|jgi:hypothetical protein|nr:hypothetical protein [Candidatus Cloacimonadota bacterium]